MAKKTVKKSAALKILVANGVNLDLLGKREKSIYGHFNLKDLEKYLKDEGSSIAQEAGVSLDFDFFQTNDETALLEKLSGGKWDGVILNPGAWTHTSVALRDRLAGLEVTFVEVHISNLAAREEFRKTSFSAAHAKGVVYGFGMESYLVGLFGLVKVLAKERS